MRKMNKMKKIYKVPFKTQTQRSLLLFAAIAVTALFSSIASAADEASEYALEKNFLQSQYLPARFAAR